MEKENNTTANIAKEIKTFPPMSVFSANVGVFTNILLRIF